MTRPDGGVENSYRYDAFGNLLERKETVPNRILYTGQQYDQETGQYYLRARYYNPVVGRFLQEDTYHGDGLNLYAYCANNPVVYYDPSGHDSAAVMKKAEEPDLPVGVNKGGSNTVNPNDIRFSQSSVNGSAEIVESMRNNGWAGDPIDVVRMPDGGLTTIDNTRVVAARQAGIDVQANIHAYDDLLPSEYIDRFTTKKGVPTTWGDTITLRIGKQNATFRNNNSFGSVNMDNIK